MSLSTKKALILRKRLDAACFADVFIAMAVTNAESQEVVNSADVQFAERLKRLRANKGFSQKEIADMLDLNPVNYGRYERGLSQPSAETLSKLAEVLGVSADYILDGDTQGAAVANLEDGELLSMFVETENLPNDDKLFVKNVLKAVLTDRKLKNHYNAPVKSA